MVQNYEETWKFIERNQEAIDIVLQLEEQGFGAISYFRDVIDDKVKPIEHYWQTGQAEGPESED